MSAASRSAAPRRAERRRPHAFLFPSVIVRLTKTHDSRAAAAVVENLYASLSRTKRYFAPRGCYKS
jgi:hypothetical protein